MIKAALFDLDGVIIDTEGQYFRFWDSIGKAFFPEIADFANRIKGNTLTAIFTDYFEGKETLAKDVEQRLLAFEDAMNYEMFPGVETFLSQTRAVGIPCAIVTSSNRNKMASLTKQLPTLTAMFDRVFTAEDTGRGKPFPDCYQRAAETMGASPEECVVFEDSVNGLRAGHDSGAFVVGLTTTNSHDIVGQWADMVCEGLHNCPLEAIVQAMARRQADYPTL